MTVTKDNIYRHEFVGLRVKIISHTDNNWIGKSGTIIDESKNMFQMDIDGIERSIPKKGAKLRIKINGKEIEIDCSKLTLRPEDRIKKAKSATVLLIASVMFNAQADSHLQPVHGKRVVT